jgi:hypothetical protein
MQRSLQLQNPLEQWISRSTDISNVFEEKRKPEMVRNPRVNFEWTEKFAIRK